MNRDRKPVKDPRRLGPCAVAIVETLKAHGIAGARFYKQRHGVAEFEPFDGAATVKVRFATSPKSREWAAKKTARDVDRLIQEAMAMEACR